MTLSVLDRLLLLNLLPAEGDITTLRIVRTLREELSFTEDEHIRLKLSQSEGNVTWDATVPEAEKEIALGLKATGLIVDALKDLSDRKKLSQQYLGLYERFVD